MTRIFWRRLIGTGLIAFFSLFLTRLVFLINLRSYFDGSLTDYIDAFWFGVRFDWLAISYLLGIYFLFLPFLHGARIKKIAGIYFLGMLGAMNLLNCIDAEFFKFTSRRSTNDLFEFAFLSDDIFNIAPNLLSQFWYLIAVFILIMLFSARLYYWVMQKEDGKRSLLSNAVGLIPIVLLLVIGSRGGLQPIPLSIINAGTTDQPQLNSVVLNTPFTILKTLGKPELEHYSFKPSEKASISPIKHFQDSPFHGKLKNSNVVILIVESMATEYVGFLNGLDVSYTPTIDSLCGESFVFTNGFANGHRSIEGIPAILASTTTLMYEPFSTSRYAGNQFTSLANVLNAEGYYTTFMHGGNKNSMNMESFAIQAGFDLIYDRDDYPEPDKHYDGFWGISDHYFLNNCTEEYSTFKQPFLSCVFTLSSHNPYTIPEEYQNRFPKGTLPIHESVGYADEALRQFFSNASETDWYDNTLFVITADHTSLSEHSYFQTKLGSLRIPMILFHPTEPLLKGISSTIIQQADIMPTVLDLLGYDKPFFSFGVSAFDQEAEHAAVAFTYDQFQVLKDSILTCFDGTKTTYVTNVNTDPMLHSNMVTEGLPFPTDGERYLKAYIENYSTALNFNRMTSDNWSRVEK